MFRSKKADSVVTILVLLTLLLVCFSLFQFFTSKWAGEEKITNSYALQDFYLKQDNVVFLMKEVSRGILEDSSTISSSEFIGQFKANFKKNAEKFEELRPYVSIVENGDYEGTSIVNNKLLFSLKDFSSSDKLILLSKKADSDIIYQTRVVFEIGF
jgi:hypothetical protein